MWLACYNPWRVHWTLLDRKRIDRTAQNLNIRDVIFEFMPPVILNFWFSWYRVPRSAMHADVAIFLSRWISGIAIRLMFEVKKELHLFSQVHRKEKRRSANKRIPPRALLPTTETKHALNHALADSRAFLSWDWRFRFDWLRWPLTICFPAVY